MRPHNERLTRLARMSAWLAHASKIAAVIFLIVNVFMWLVSGVVVDAARSQSSLPAPMKITMTTEATMLALAVSTAYVALLAVALWSIAKLFTEFSKGAIFVPETGVYLRRAGLYLLVFAALAPVFRAMIGVIVTMANPPGERALSISFSSHEVILGLIAALLVMLGHIMAEASDIADDNSRIV
ncbi:MAG: DUF2975 domain-containing protein [Alphaproteobacteria bacterium]|nr:DUF2975 domain-containing protein [Alphaproteobacteria bacterium]